MRTSCTACASKYLGGIFAFENYIYHDSICCKSARPLPVIAVLLCNFQEVWDTFRSIRRNFVESYVGYHHLKCKVGRCSVKCIGRLYYVAVASCTQSLCLYSLMKSWKENIWPLKQCLLPDHTIVSQSIIHFEAKMFIELCSGVASSLWIVVRSGLCCIPTAPYSHP